MTAIVGFLIWLAVVAIVIYIVIWAITSIVSPPPKVTQLMYVIGVLILLYYCLVFFPGMSLPGFPTSR